MKNLTTFAVALIVRVAIPLILVSVVLPIGICSAQADKTIVTAENFPRVESDLAIKKVFDKVGLSKFDHNRLPTPVDNQPIIRMNRDTLYSRAVLDLSKPAKITMPDSGDRYMGLQIISQDHYTRVFMKPGTYEVTQKDVGTRYAYAFVRTFMDASSDKDIKVANALQDKIVIEGGGKGPLEVPDWDLDTAAKFRSALLVLASTTADTSRFFGTPDQTTPIRHLLGSAMGWAGLPRANAVYDNVTPPNNDGKTAYKVTVKDVPVDAFWSITVYGGDGFMPKNALGVYAFNDKTAKPNADGSITIHFGACDDGRVNCIPISEGWNYIIRMYEPRQEILDGKWKFPAPTPVK